MVPSRDSFLIVQDAFARSKSGGISPQNATLAHYLPLPSPDPAGWGALFVLVAGVNGQGAHAEVTLQVTEMVQRLWDQYARFSPTSVLHCVLRQAVEDADVLVRRAEEEHPTMITAVLVVGGKALVAHVGTNRLYLYRQESLTQITTDHSEAVLASPRIREEDLLSHPKRHKVTRALGWQEPVLVDQYQFPLYSGDLLLLCSADVWERLHSWVLRQIANANLLLAPMASLMLSMATSGEEDAELSILVSRIASQTRLPRTV